MVLVFEIFFKLQFTEIAAIVSDFLSSFYTGMYEDVFQD